MITVSRFKFVFRQSNVGLSSLVVCTGDGGLIYDRCL